MKVIKPDNQTVNLKNKIDLFFNRAIKNRKNKGFCITKDIMAIVMDKWSLFILYNLGYHGTLRFGELRTNIRGISPRMLSVTLKKLENHGIIKRKVYAEVPPKVEYNLTEFGKKFAEKSVDLNEWLLNEYTPNYK